MSGNLKCYFFKNQPILIEKKRRKKKPCVAYGYNAYEKKKKKPFFAYDVYMRPK
jgi:hypothetical protein